MAADNADELYRRVTWRLVPFLMVCYVAAYLDRVNVGFAKLGMSQEIGISDAVYGVGAGIFFIGYFLFEVPSNMALHRFGAPRWIARIMISWALVSAACAFVEGAKSLYLVRFLLGVAEAGFFPGIIFYLTLWYPAARRGRIIGMFMVAIPLSGVVGGPLSGFVMESMEGFASWSGWRWMFVIEAVPALILGFLVPRFLPSGVEDAAWLTPAERDRIVKDLAADEPAFATRHARVRDILADRHVQLLSLLYFCCIMGQYGFTFWLPTMIKDISGGSPLVVGLFSVLPYASAAIAMVVISRSSDVRGERRWHLALPLLLGALALLWAPGVDGVVPAILLLCIAAAATLSASPLFWNLPTSFLRGGAAAIGIAAINSVGNLAGFVSPSLIGWLNTVTGTRTAGTVMLAVTLAAGAALVVAVTARSSWGRVGQGGG